MSEIQLLSLAIGFIGAAFAFAFGHFLGWKAGRYRPDGSERR